MAAIPDSARDLLTKKKAFANLATAAFPSGEPPATHFRMVSFSLCVRRRSFRNSP